MSDVFERVKGVVKEHLGTEDSKLVLEASFIDDLGADSLDLVELTMGFEQEFDLEIKDEQAEKIGTVGDAVRLIEEALNS